MKERVQRQPNESLICENIVEKFDDYFNKILKTVKEIFQRKLKDGAKAKKNAWVTEDILKKSGGTVS